MQLNSSVQVLFEGLLGHYFNPSSSCAALPLSSPSGYYWVRASNGSAVHVYCDMTRSCGGVTGGWMRVAELDMTNSSHQCPSGLRQRNDSNIRTCVFVGNMHYTIHTDCNVLIKWIECQSPSPQCFMYGSLSEMHTEKILCAVHTPLC
jgi:hypothetical protein